MSVKQHNDQWFDRAYEEVVNRSARLTGDWAREAARTRRLANLAMDCWLDQRPSDARDLIASLRGALVYMERTTKHVATKHEKLPKVTDPGYDPNDTPKVSQRLPEVRPLRRGRRR